MIDEKIKTLLDIKYNYTPKAFVRTFGCQQNVSDGELIKGQLQNIGYEIVTELDDADFVIFNTCAVRETAEDRVMGNIGNLVHHKQKKKDCIIAVCGCMTQQEKVANSIKQKFPHVSLVFGTNAIHKLPEMVYSLLNGQKRLFITGEPDEDIHENMPAVRDHKTRGWLPIMYGCDNYCTYCIVPYVRGRERSRKSVDVINEAKELIKSGIKEITLLGQNVNSYKSDITFPELLSKVNSLDGEFIIRFMTSHPKDCTNELLQIMSQCEKVPKHLHLPFQSGNNEILDKMNRKYTREEYLALISKARELMPDITFSSDVIVGFPGENHEQFCDTLSLIKQVKFNALFTFIFSKRSGTPAADMFDPVSGEDKSKWFRELLKTQEKLSEVTLSKFKNKTVRVLCEEYKDGIIWGKSDNNINTEFIGDETLIGQFVNVRITEPKTYILKGEKV